MNLQDKHLWEITMGTNKTVLDMTLREALKKFKSAMVDYDEEDEDAIEEYGMAEQGLEDLENAIGLLKEYFVKDGVKE